MFAGGDGQGIEPGCNPYRMPGFNGSSRYSGRSLPWRTERYRLTIILLTSLDLRYPHGRE